MFGKQNTIFDEVNDAIDSAMHGKPSIFLMNWNNQEKSEISIVMEGCKETIPCFKPIRKWMDVDAEDRTKLWVRNGASNLIKLNSMYYLRVPYAKNFSEGVQLFLKAVYANYISLVRLAGSPIDVAPAIAVTIDSISNYNTIVDQVCKPGKHMSIRMFEQMHQTQQTMQDARRMFIQIDDVEDRILEVTSCKTLGVMVNQTIGTLINSLVMANIYGWMTEEDVANACKQILEAADSKFPVHAEVLAMTLLDDAIDAIMERSKAGCNNTRTDLTKKIDAETDISNTLGIPMVTATQQGTSDQPVNKSKTNPQHGRTNSGKSGSKKLDDEVIHD